jgi:hypothetical protein
VRSAAVVAALSLVVASCGGDDADAGGAAPLPSGAIDVAASPTVELPAEFPSEVPLPADMLVEEANQMAGETSQLFEVTGWFDGDAVAAGRDYVATVEAAGFEVTGRTEAPTNVFFTAESGDWTLSAGFFPDPVRNAGTSIGLTLAPVATG